MTRTLEAHIERLSVRQREEAAGVPRGERLSDAITTVAGSMAFAFIRLIRHSAACATCGDP